MRILARRGSKWFCRVSDVPSPAFSNWVCRQRLLPEHFPKRVPPSRTLSQFLIHLFGEFRGVANCWNSMNFRSWFARSQVSSKTRSLATPATLSTQFQIWMSCLAPEDLASLAQGGSPEKCIPRTPRRGVLLWHKKRPTSGR